MARNEKREKEREFIGGEEAKDNQITEVTMSKTSMTEKKKTQSRVGPSPSPVFPTVFLNHDCPWREGRGPICLS